MTARHAAQRGAASGDPVGRFLSWIWVLGTAAGFAALATMTTAELSHRDALSAMTIPDAGFPAL
ncbi:hypothetical protein [Streptomyces subrutilus]|uniref:Uncharacterized protein n=1 Tax=Streptomyces subrutilus TaxID=36818 RepID=A0A5P2UNI3_9ACTN|nr:hypothetical protein [Streptomyces subrutilus]QEU80718.1 hypothetical protein CP968_22725 [Streptomyces subrutilus]WSJ29992.1 hypothetical protein OG479_12105 [Streptomyces subrutilus]GGZ73975.1 hypothetical protein GCM10010371_37160 [Streptomyces subrutilus]